MSEKIVIVGRNGQVGRALREVYPKAKSLTREELDISDRAAVEGLIGRRMMLLLMPLHTLMRMNRKLRRVELKRGKLMQRVLEILLK